MKVLVNTRKTAKKQRFKPKSDYYGFCLPDEDCEGMSTSVVYPSNTYYSNVSNTDSYAPGDNRIPGSLFGKNVARRRKKGTSEDSEESGGVNYTGKVGIARNYNSNTYPFTEYEVFFKLYDTDRPVGAVKAVKSSDDSVGCRLALSIDKTVFKDLQRATIYKKGAYEAIDRMVVDVRRLLLALAIKGVFEKASVSLHRIHLPSGPEFDKDIAIIMGGVKNGPSKVSKENDETIIDFDSKFWNNFTSKKDRPFLPRYVKDDIIITDEFYKRFIDPINGNSVMKIL